MTAKRGLTQSPLLPSPFPLNPCYSSDALGVLQEHQHGVRNLLRAYGDVVSTWRSAAAVSYMLDFPTALDYLRTLEGQVLSLAVHSLAVADLVRRPAHAGVAI